MIAADIRTLLEKLNHFCTKSLEASVGYCLSRTHYELTWEHMLNQFLESPDSDIALIFRHYGVSTAHVQRAVTRDLEHMSIGNAGKPAFSPTLINCIERAWSFATLLYKRNEITSGILLVSALDDMQRTVTATAVELRKIDFQKIKSELLSIIDKSPESAVAKQEESARSQEPGAVPEVLEKFCKNYTREAREGKIDLILGRDDEIRQIVDILSRRRKNNPILVGEAGVGKTAIIEGLALRIAQGDVPDTLKGVELWELDLGLLQAGASVKGEFEKRLKAVIDIAKKSAGKIVLFIDEAHTLIGAGGSEGMGDAANLLKPALARGELRTAAATTWLEYRKYFEKDPALTRRFQKITVDEPDEPKAFSMLRGIAESYQRHHGVHISDAAIKAAVSFSHRYISGRQLPDKAVDVLDTACTRVKMSRTTTPPELDNHMRRKDNAERALKTLRNDLTAGLKVSVEEITSYEESIKQAEEKITLLSSRWEKEKEIVDKIVSLQSDALNHSKDDPTQLQQLQQQIDDQVTSLRTMQGDTPLVHPFVTADLCADVIADWTGIPVGSMVKNEAQTLLELDQLVDRRVIGQTDAIKQVAEVIRSAKSGLSNPSAPIGVFLFTGPSGVGKTECALALADILFGGEKFSTVINMSEYQEKHTVSQLKGSPPGYVGYGEGGILTEAVRQKPYSIVILDEVEKAHRDILNLFYQVFDKGIMRDGEGRDINFRNTVIIMTSNLGSDTILDLCNNYKPDGSENGENKDYGESDEIGTAVRKKPSLAEVTDAIRAELTAHFQPALLARCRIIPFLPLDHEGMKKIAAMKLDAIVKRLRQTYAIGFNYTAELVDCIASQCLTQESGARNIDVIIDQTILPAISQMVLSRMQRSETENQSLNSITVTYSPEGGFSIVFE
ncbi:MAG: type VI secretion system ATPase TssH [Chitinivibrionales bacterium]|nr:type VI secretion system ATPase TssH [Chitinivibrionales bacterium]